MSYPKDGDFSEIINLTVSSLDRINNSQTSSNFTVNLPYAINKVRYVELLTLNMYNTFYTVILGVNDTIDYIDLGGNHTYTIPAGYYTISTLLSTIATGMSAVSGSQAYTVSYSTTTYLVSFSASGPFQLSFNSGTNNLKTACFLLGFIKADTTSANSATSTNTYNLTPFNPIYIKCPQFRNNGISTKTNDTYFLTIPIDTAYGNLIDFTNNSHYTQSFYYDSPISINSLDISLVGRGGQLLNLQSEWFFILKLGIN